MSIAEGQLKVSSGSTLPLYMAAIFTHMQGDAVRSGLLRQQGGAHRVGKNAAARVPDGRDVIDVHAKA